MNSRRTFLAGGAGALALLRLGGCGNNGGAVEGSVTPSNGAVTLTFTQFPKLATVGDGGVVDAGGTLLVVIRAGDTSATALSAVCTHEGCTVEYVGGSPPIHCPCHDSNFADNGAAVSGPARKALKNYAASVGADGITVTLA